MASLGTSLASSPTTFPLKPASRSIPIRLASTVESLRVFWMNRVKNSNEIDLAIRVKSPIYDEGVKCT
jgi:hypothetical protein